MEEKNTEKKITGKKDDKPEVLEAELLPDDFSDENIENDDVDEFLEQEDFSADNNYLDTLHYPQDQYALEENQ